jgi:hypothetical protein
LESDWITIARLFFTNKVLPIREEFPEAISFHVVREVLFWTGIRSVEFAKVGSSKKLFKWCSILTYMAYVNPSRT